METTSSAPRKFWVPPKSTAAKLSRFSSTWTVCSGVPRSVILSTDSAVRLKRSSGPISARRRVSRRATACGACALQPRHERAEQERQQQRDDERDEERAGEVERVEDGQHEQPGEGDRAD